MKILTILILGISAFLPAQDAASSDAALFQELDRALPRHHPKIGAQLTLSHTIEWDQAIDRLGELLVRAAETRAEPYVLFHMANALYSANRLDEAKATLEDLAMRFADHALNSAVLDPDGRSLVAQSLIDVDEEISFRKLHDVEDLPKPELDEELLVTLHFSAGDVKLKLYRNVAPEHRKNFLKLAREGFYDRTRVHRVQHGNSVTAGDPKSRSDPHNTWGSGDPGYTLIQEPSLVHHKRGTVSMMRAGGTNRSHGCQFQILLADQPHLDFLQSGFGEVVDGLDALDRVSKGITNQYGAPAEDCFINGITIEKVTE